MKDLTLAIDLGGTNTKLALVNRELQVIQSASVPTVPEKGPASNIDEWIAVVKPWLLKNEVKAIGIGMPGPLDSERGVILETPNLKNWELFSFPDYFQKKLNLPCFIENDANCAALGEWSQHRVSDLVVLTLGTGVGSGVIANNKLVRGAGGLAVEAGHMTLNFEGPACECGKRGCLEAYVGGFSFVKRFKEENSSLAATSPEDIFKLAHRGQAEAQRAVHLWTTALAVGVGSLINIFNPRKVVFTGGLSHAFSQIKDDFSTILHAQAFKHSVEYAEVEVSKLQNQAGLIGAALWAQQKNERAHLSALSK